MSTTFSHGKSGCSCSRDTCKGCITYETYKTVKTNTNADRIRAMTDEELAQHLYWWDNSPLHASSERWLDWLKEEVHNGMDS